MRHSLRSLTLRVRTNPFDRPNNAAADDLIIWVAVVHDHAQLAGLPVDDGNFVEVDTDLHSIAEHSLLSSNSAVVNGLILGAW